MGLEATFRRLDEGRLGGWFRPPGRGYPPLMLGPDLLPRRFAHTHDEPGVALVAGASRGLGLAIARDLVSRGWRVHICGRDPESLHRAGTSLGGPGSLAGHVADVRDAAAVDRLVGDVVAAEGRIDVALHVAGVIQVVPLDGVTRGHVREAVDTMLWGPVHLSLAVIPEMRAAGHGHIGIVSSVGGLVAVPRLLPYCVAKFGAVGLAEGLAAELSGSGVTVTSVTPWLMRTGGHEHARFAGEVQADFAWFGPGASLPAISVPVQRAARRIVDGVLAGRPCVSASVLTSVARRVHGLAPATTVRLLGLGARLLPGGEPARDWRREDAPSVPGMDAARRSTSRTLEVLTGLGRRAAAKNNEYPGDAGRGAAPHPPH